MHVAEHNKRKEEKPTTSFQRTHQGRIACRLRMGENTRNKSSLLALGSKVRVVAKAAHKRGDGELPKKKKASAKEVCRNGGWCNVASVDFGGRSKPRPFHMTV